ncbi:hypothetical protein RYH80_18835 [Halobaculum sp. MBLA0147]|uniref:hypothetical protein n=1 Tax=Halobaculum sp. MBLA0147 TaxID=3079934 RepID=UPI0035262BDC
MLQLDPHDVTRTDVLNGLSWVLVLWAVGVTLLSFVIPVPFTDPVTHLVGVVTGAVTLVVLGGLGYGLEKL